MADPDDGGVSQTAPAAEEKEAIDSVVSDVAKILEELQPSDREVLLCMCKESALILSFN